MYALSKMEFRVDLSMCYEGDIPIEYVINALKILNDVYYSIEVNSLKRVREEIPDIPQIALDASEYRINRYRNNSVLVKEVSSGSYEFVIIGTGLALWILQNTLGETIKEAWKKSSFHNKIVDFLTKDWNIKHFKFFDTVKNNFKKKIPCQIEEVEEAIAADGGSYFKFKLNIQKSANNIPPASDKIHEDPFK